MGAMQDVLAQHQVGEISDAVLREKHKEEYDRLANVFETVQKDGWMATKDALAGATVGEKVADYKMRVEEISSVEKAIHDLDEVLKVRAAMRPPSAPTPMVVPPNDGAASPPLGFAATQISQMERTYESLSAKMGKSEAVLKEFPERQLPSGTTPMPPGGVVLRMQMKDALPTLKTFQISTPLPTDVVAMPYPMRTQPLDYINMRTEPGSIMFYHRPADPATFATASAVADDWQAVNTHAAPRTRGAALGTNDVTWTRIQLTKQSIGSWMPINYEDMNDNVNVMTVASEQLMVDVRLLMIREIFQGGHRGGTAPANVPPHWEDLDTILSISSGANQNTSAVPTPGGTAPNYINVESIEPLQATEQIMANLWHRGVFPTVVFLNAQDYVKIRAQQRIARYMQTNYREFPMGDLHGIPMCLTDQLPANTMIIGGTNPTNLEIVMVQEFQVGMSDDYQFANNQRSIRVVAYGNLAVYRPASLWKLTATDNLTLIRTGV